MPKIPRFMEFTAYLRERLRIQELKSQSCPMPWSTDPIFQGTKFCCVIRDDDRTSYEARNAIECLPEKERLPYVVSFRVYNRVSSLKKLLEIDIRNFEAVYGVMQNLSPALNALAYKIQPKGRLFNLEDVCRQITHIALRVEKGWAPYPTAQETCRRICSDFSMSGTFVAYQILQDIRWIYGPYPDEQTWCLVGPGAYRGIQRLKGNYTAQHWTKRNTQVPLDKNLGMPYSLKQILLEILGEVKRLNIPGFSMFELEHNLCEFDKYCRVKTGEGTGRKYTPTKE